MKEENDSRDPKATKRILDRVNEPSDLKALSSDELNSLASEIRQEIIEVTSRNGGHLAPNLGVVEITLGLHLALNSPEDKIIWDVGHQSYVHKLITGRREDFSTLRKHKGISGFIKRSESPHDAFDSGHASNSISVALGLAIGYERQNADNSVAVVIGDGSLTGGMAYEALNQAGHLRANLIVILNDNEMSIDNNVGAMSSYLNRLRIDPKYNRFRDEIDHIIRKIPAVGERMVNIGESLRQCLKQALVPGMLFEELGFKYIGPVDGHNIDAIYQSVMMAKEVGGPIVIHAVSKKGKGYEPAEINPDLFHGTGAFEIETGKPIAIDTPVTYTSVFGDTMVEIAKKNRRLVAITAAMSRGTGLTEYAEKYPDRFFDVGIAEQHAVTFAAGMSLSGWQPVVAIYSTFLQRAFDQIIEDVCLQELPIILAIDRCGLVGDDGPTHHGSFDLSFLSQIPGMIIMAPKDENELRHMVYTATKLNRSVAIRFPRGAGVGVKLDDDLMTLPLGRSEVLIPGKDICILAVGRMVEVARVVTKGLSDDGYDATLVNVRYVKPIDSHLLEDLTTSHRLIVTIEENVLIGGYGSVVSQFYSKNESVQVINFGLPDCFVSHGDVDKLFEEVGLSPETIIKKIEHIAKSKEIKIRSSAGK